MGWFVAASKKYVVLMVRFRRKEYWYLVLFNFLITVVLVLIDGAIGTLNPSTGLGLLSGIYSLADLIPSIAVLVRRLCDTGRSGLWVLISFVPLIGAIVLLVFAVQEGTPGSNRYGPNPKIAVA